MPRIKQVLKTTGPEAARILRSADRDALMVALMEIAASALAEDSAADTAAVVYEQLAVLGIIVP